MKCKKCEFDNLKGSTYCQECGVKFIKRKVIKKKKTSSEQEKKEGVFESINQNLDDDVVFEAKKKRVGVREFIKISLIVIGVGFLGLIVLWMMSPEEDTSAFPLEYLDITENEIYYDNEGESYLMGVLHNDYTEDVKNVAIRLDFYRDEALKRHFDTRTQILEYGAEAMGAFSFETPLYIYPDEQYWWTWIIEGADYDY